jgi:queuosine biosynthesis protein QueC
MSTISPLLFRLPKKQDVLTPKFKSSGRPAFSFSFNSPFEFARCVDRDLPNVQPFNGQQYRLDLNSFAALAHRPLARLEADLAFIAAAVYLADRAAPRHPYGINGQAYWRRSMHLDLCVSDSRHWKASESLLSSTLEFLTEDDWSFEFRSGRPVTGSESQLMLWKSNALVSMTPALFSGGLDSLAGAIRSADAPSASRLLLVSGVTHSRLAICQVDQAERLRLAFPSMPIDHLQVDYGFTDRPKSIVLESSQRTRAFIHCVFGTLGASMVGASGLDIYENGIGALNLPLDATQLGSQNSRGTHPTFLKRMSMFASAALERQYTIRLPFQFATKAEVLRHPAIQKNGNWLSLSNSCDIYPNYLHRQSHCGACPACLFRRMSLHSANLPDPDEDYSSAVLPSKRHAPASNLNRLEHQATVLRRLIPKGWDALAVHFPALYDLELENGPDLPATQSLFRDQVLSLYRRYLDEWTAQSPALRLLPPPTLPHVSSPSPCPQAPPHLHPTLVRDSARHEKPAA